MSEAMIDLCRLSLVVCWEVFQVVLVHLVCNSSLFLHLLLRVTCRSQFDLCLCIFLSAVSTFISSKISSFLFWLERAVLQKNLISIGVSRCFVLFFFRVQISLPYKGIGRASALCTGLFISPSGISDPCGTVAGMVTPKGSMSTEGETPIFCPTFV
jgi:hypothetical protein